MAFAVVQYDIQPSSVIQISEYRETRFSLLIESSDTVIISPLNNPSTPPVVDGFAIQFNFGVTGGTAAQHTWAIGNAAWTVAGWFKFLGNPPGGRFTAPWLGFTGGPGAKGFGLFRGPLGLTGYPQFSVDVFTIGGFATPTFVDTTGIVGDEWNYIAVKYDTVNLVLNINGTDYLSIAKTVTIVEDGFDLNDESPSATPTSDNFQLSDLRVFSRVLSNAELFGLYNAGVAQYSHLPKPELAQWHFDEGTGFQAANSIHVANRFNLSADTEWIILAGPDTFPQMEGFSTPFEIGWRNYGETVWQRFYAFNPSPTDIATVTVMEWFGQPSLGVVLTPDTTVFDAAKRVEPNCPSSLLSPKPSAKACGLVKRLIEKVRGK